MERHHRAEEAEEAEDACRRVSHCCSKARPRSFTASRQAGLRADLRQREHQALLGYAPTNISRTPTSGASASIPTIFRTWKPSRSLLREGRHAAEYRFRNKDGTYCWVNDEQHLIRDEKGEPVEIVGSWSDITQRKPAEQAEDASARIALLLESAPAVIYSFKATGDFAPTFISENVKRVLGYCPDEYLKNADFWRARVHPEDVAAVEAEQAKLFEHGRHTAEYRFRKSDGTYCWVSDEQHLIRDAHGNPLEVVGSWSDITARKTAEQAALQASDSVSPTPSNRSPKASPSTTRRTGWCLATTSRRAVRLWRGAAETRHDL